MECSLNIISRKTCSVENQSVTNSDHKLRRCSYFTDTGDFHWVLSRKQRLQGLIWTSWRPRSDQRFRSGVRTHWNCDCPHTTCSSLIIKFQRLPSPSFLVLVFNIATFLSVKMKVFLLSWSEHYNIMWKLEGKPLLFSLKSLCLTLILCRRSSSKKC